MTITNLNKAVFKKIFYQILHILLIFLILLLFLLIVSRNMKEQKKLRETFIKNINYDRLTGVLKREKGIEKMNEIIRLNGDQFLVAIKEPLSGGTMEQLE